MAVEAEDLTVQPETPVEETPPVPDPEPDPVPDQATPASEWQRETSKMVHLPTGRWARVRLVNLLTLIAQGVLPVWDESALAGTRKGGKVGAKQVMEVVRRFHRPDLYVTFLRAVMVAGCVDPKMTQKPPEEAAADEVSVDLLSADEQAALLNAISALSGFSKDLAEFSRPF